MIDLDDVSVSAGEVRLLAPISASVDAGGALIVRGRNGAGKSTLVRLVTGQLTPTSGTVTTTGPVDHLPQRLADIGSRTADGGL